MFIRNWDKSKAANWRPSINSGMHTTLCACVVLYFSVCMWIGKWDWRGGDWMYVWSVTLLHFYTIEIIDISPFVSNQSCPSRCYTWCTSSFLCVDHEGMQPNTWCPLVGEFESLSVTSVITINECTCVSPYTCPIYFFLPQNMFSLCFYMCVCIPTVHVHIQWCPMLMGNVMVLDRD